MITDIVSTTGMLLAFVVIVFGMAGKPVPGEKRPLWK